MPGSTERRRMGRWRLSEWLVALCSVSGAISTTSVPAARSAARIARMPALAYPSSFDRRTRGLDMRGRDTRGRPHRPVALVSRARGPDSEEPDVDVEHELQEHPVEARAQEEEDGAVAAPRVDEGGERKE